MIRPRNPLELAESQALSRIASLAASIMVTLRRPGQGVYDSERQLRGWLTADRVEFSNNDLAPALALLEATGRIGRAAAKANQPRRGWVVASAPEMTAQSPVQDAHGAVTENAPDPQGSNGVASPVIDAASVRVAVRLAREIHYQGSIPLAGVELHLAKLNRNLKPAQVLDYAVANGWLTISDDGLRVLPADVFPSLEDSALRYVPAPDDQVLAT